MNAAKKIAVKLGQRSPKPKQGLTASASKLYAKFAFDCV